MILSGDLDGQGPDEEAYEPSSSPGTIDQPSFSSFSEETPLEEGSFEGLEQEEETQEYPQLPIFEGLDSDSLESSQLSFNEVEAVDETLYDMNREIDFLVSKFIQTLSEKLAERVARIQEFEFITDEMGLFENFL